MGFPLEPWLGDWGGLPDKGWGKATAPLALRACDDIDGDGAAFDQLLGELRKVDGPVRPEGGRGGGDGGGSGCLKWGRGWGAHRRGEGCGVRGNLEGGHSGWGGRSGLLKRGSDG